MQAANQLVERVVLLPSLTQHPRKLAFGLLSAIPRTAARVLALQLAELSPQGIRRPCPEALEYFNLLFYAC